MAKKNLLTKGKAYVEENKAGLLTGFSILGLAATIYLTYKSSLKANEIIGMYHDEKFEIDTDDRPEEEKKKEKRELLKYTTKKLIPVVAPTILSASLTTACILGSHSASKKKIALLATTYGLAQETITSLNKKMKDVLGEGKVEEIKTAIAKDKIAKTPPSDELLQLSESVQNGSLCYDLVLGKYFIANADKIKRAINSVSSDVVQDGYATVHDLYYDMIDSMDGIPFIAEDIGWNYDSLDRGRIPVTIGATLTPNEKPCLTIDYGYVMKNDLFKTW